ncbi:LacI family DNA-binding transcriptional regulator [Chelativorans sp. AA-79]|uniref:LacI family DNA-binding transcriptional regulator n=1 Tax=Chelativorans sp. AA-79 TaxID=3028735 RepID=UPI0023F8C860|nr:LacI family DNA-binding transcriptional regulator [Chelativorans sp. AA-79]WEX11084.1 LacI family DNA-binding transcriptional regulator [Chelativorans sp. AA-79]
MAKVTLATIAQHTGLSKFAVSRSLSGKDGVSEETRRRVREAAAQLGYSRADAEPEQLTLGVIFHDTDLINSELHLLIQNGAQSEAERLGYRLNMRWTHQPEEIEAAVRACSGAVLVGPHSPESLARAYAQGKPIVRQGWLDPLEQADHVGGTDHEGGAAVANYLLALGHRSIAYVHGAPGYRGRIERFYGVREVLEKHSDVEFREMKFHAEMRFTEHLLAVHAAGFRPTAFFCAHDGLALTVVSELLRLGYRIPEDASVVGFGDYSAATQISPQLTTVKVYGHQIGAASVRLLDDRINGRIPPDTAVRMHIANRIVERASCGPRKMSEASVASAL